jgi:hypothetical protein
MHIFFQFFEIIILLRTLCYLYWKFENKYYIIELIEFLIFIQQSIYETIYIYSFGFQIQKIVSP